MELFSKFVYCVFLVVTCQVCNISTGDSCNVGGKAEFCDYGCCGSGSEQKCCSISTSVLVVACVVSGLVLIALVCAIVICCWKSYQDKQASRVRRLQIQEAMNAPRVPGVEPPKPPEYLSAPPAYSEEMPDTHFRPPTVSGHIPYNQRFRGTTPLPAHGSVNVTSTSGRHPNSTALRTTHIPGAVEIEAPPPYRQFERGRTPAERRHRRFIRSPVPEYSEETENQTTHSSAESETETLDTVSVNTPVSGPSRDHHIVLGNQERNQQTTGQSRTEDLRSSRSRAQESPTVSETVDDSRAQTVARVLGARSRMSRIPSRVHAMQSRTSNVNSRVSSSQNHAPSTRTGPRSASNGALTVQEESIEDISAI